MGFPLEKRMKSTRDTQKLRRVSEDPSRVLVVDDSGATRLAMERRLRAMGHEVVLASSGEEAFLLCMERPFDLMVSDVTMGAVSGVHLCRMLRAEPTTRDLPIVLLTADDGPRSRFWGNHAGCDAYVSKREPEALNDAVRFALAARPGSNPSPIPQRIDPLERLSRVLDDHLLQAVVDREARSLMRFVHDREALTSGALELFEDVLACSYAVLRIDGDRLGSSSALLSRAPWPVEPSRQSLLKLGFAPTTGPRTVRRAGPLVGDVKAGETVIEPILAGRELIGQLRLYGGVRGIGRDDRETGRWLSGALGPVIKSMLLMEETRHLATTDSLTGLRNRRNITARLAEEVSRAGRYGTPLSLLLADIDHFKSVNDNYGHQMGDEVLRAVSNAFGTAFRNVDLVGRWGGEEFLIVLPETQGDGAHIVAERVREAVAALGPFAGGPEHVTLSVGVTAYRIGLDAEQLVGRADEALYAAKEQGRDRVVLAS